MPERERPPEPVSEWRTFTTVEELAEELELCRVPVDADLIDATRLLELNGSWASRRPVRRAQRRRQATAATTPAAVDRADRQEDRDAVLLPGGGPGRLRAANRSTTRRPGCCRTELGGNDG